METTEVLGKSVCVCVCVCVFPLLKYSRLKLERLGLS